MMRNLMGRLLAPAASIRMVLAVAFLATAACARDAPLDPSGRALPPDGAARLVNPLCNLSGQWHGFDTLATAVTWPASGNPHWVYGTVVLAPGSTLTVEPGAIVCFTAGGGLQSTGGRLMARGTSAAPIVLTAYDPAEGWQGIHLQGATAAGSQIRHATVEYAALGATAITASGQHLAYIDTTVVRQSGAAVSLSGRRSRFGWSRVDTTTDRYRSAITLGDSGRVEAFVIRGAAGVGLQIDGTVGVRVMGGRIEGSGGVGIRAPNQTGIASVHIVRVVGGQSYPIETTAPLLQRLYGSTVVNQDSLKGNARDTVVMLGGTLTDTLWVRNGLPWHVKAPIEVVAGGMLGSQANGLLVMDSAASIAAGGGGRVQLRGTRTAPVVLTADDPARGWQGIQLYGAPAQPSYVTNARVEHVAYGRTAVMATDSHTVRVDSVVLRRNGAAVSLLSPGSRLTRSRVDTTLTWYLPAVRLAADAVLESTLIRGSSSSGVEVNSAAVQVQSCEVRGSVYDGILLWTAVAIHNCNLVDNGIYGVNDADVHADPDATNNWWGDAAGPYGPSGDGASSTVIYTPWLTAPYTLPYVP